MIEITGFIKDDGPLTKRIKLDADDKLVSDGSHCIMAQGKAIRISLPDLGLFAKLIGRMAPEKAIGLGTPREDLPGEVNITTKARLDKLNGASAPHLIARTAEHIVYRPGQQALALLDFDTKGMPAAVRTRVDAAGGFWPALVTVLPELALIGRVLRASTSAGLYRSDTGQRLPGSDGVHAFVVVADGGDIERFLRTLHDRCWLHGLGWHMVGAGGQLLDRSIVDRMVGAPERLVFEGAPVLEPPLAQDQAARLPVVTDGDALDTLAACPPLRIVEREKLRALHAKDAPRLAPDRAKARETFVAGQAERIAARTGCTAVAAHRIVERQCDGVLHPDVVLPFDDPDLAECTVGNVLAEPDKFVGATLADPLEGVGYGACVAKVMRRADGTVWIHSFAHGRTVYELKRNAAAIETILLATDEA